VLICYNIAHIAQVMYYGVFHIHYIFNELHNFSLYMLHKLTNTSKFPVQLLRDA